MSTVGLSRPRFMRGPSVEQPFVAPVIRTRRLVLRPHRIEDAADWYTIQSDPRVVRYMRWPVRDRRASLKHLKHRTRHTVIKQADDFMALAVELDGRLIGDVSLHLRSVQRTSRSVEMSWILHPEFEHHGYAAEAADAVLDLAFGPLGATIATALVDVDNAPSVALAERLAFMPAAEDESTISFITTSGMHSRVNH